MSNSATAGSQRIRYFVLLGLATIAAGPMQAAAAQQSADSTQTQTRTADTAKAAARKAKFDEDRRRLEGTEPGVTSNPGQTLFISPCKVGMLVGDSHSFSVFDIDGHDLTSSAEWSWSDSSLASFASRGAPTITSKYPGTVTVYARTGNQTAEATVTIFPGDKLAIGTVQWDTPVIPGYRGVKFVQAVPTANGPDIYASDINDQGDMLLRALLSDGRQLWMRKFPAHGGSIKPPIPFSARPRVPSPSAQPHP